MRYSRTIISIAGNRPGRKFIPWLVSELFYLTLVIVTVLLLVPISRQLIVTDDQTGEVLYSTSIEPGQTFSIKYIHSVNKSPVEDIFDISHSNRIVLKKTIFRSFGAGIPYELEDGQSLDVMGDRIEISNINKRIDRFLLKIGTVAEHTLCIKGREIRMDSLAGPMRTVRLEVQNVRVTFFLRRIINERKGNAVTNAGIEYAGSEGNR